MVRTISSTPGVLSNMGTQGIQNLVIHWKKITRSPHGNPRSSKTPPNTPSGLAPSILCILAPSHAFLGLPGCLKWTILPPKKTLLGEKLPRAPMHPRNVQNITEHSIWMGNTDIMHPDPFFTTWLTEKALTSIYLNAAIGESSEITPGTLGIPKWPKKRPKCMIFVGPIHLE